MELNRKESKANILKLAFDLEKQYPELNFKHHCYLRIAFDNCLNCKWNEVIKSPFLNNCYIETHLRVSVLLNIYLDNKEFLLEHNQNSLNYRKK